SRQCPRHPKSPDEGFAGADAFDGAVREPFDLAGLSSIPAMTAIRAGRRRTLIATTVRHCPSPAERALHVGIEVVLRAIAQPGLGLIERRGTDAIRHHDDISTGNLVVLP